MAGSMELAIASDGNPLTAIREQWEVEYSRFFRYPSSLSSIHPSLEPLSSAQRNRFRGTWISSSSSSSDSLASLKLINADHDSIILLITFRHKILVSSYFLSIIKAAWIQFHASIVSYFVIFLHVLNMIRTLDYLIHLF